MDDKLFELTFFDMARASHVKRWGIINTTRQQTVAEHSFMVMLISLELAKLLGMTPIDKMDMAKFVLSAAFHDIPETKYGDPPTPGKTLLAAAAGNPRFFDELDMRIMTNGIPYIGGVLPVTLAWIIKAADLIEAYHFLSDSAAGPHACKVRDDIYWRIVKFASEASVAMPNRDWVSSVATILQSLGLPRPLVGPDSEKGQRL